MDSSVLEITIETFVMEKFMPYATHPMLAIWFENSKRSMLAT